MSTKNMNIGKKLITGFLVVAAIALAIGIVGWSGIYRLEKGIGNMAENRIPDLQSLGVMNRERMAIRAQTLDILAQLDVEHSVAVASYRRIQQERKISWDRVDEAMKSLKSIPRQSEKGRELMAALGAEYEAWRRIYADLDTQIERFVNSADTAQRAALYREYREAVNRMIPLSDAMGATLVKLTDNNNTNTTRMAAEQVTQAILMERAIFTCMVIGVLAAITLGVLLSRSISRPLVSVVGHLETMSKGDYTVEIETIHVERGDEIGSVAKAVATLSASMRKMVGDLTVNANTVASSATELSAVSVQTAQSVQALSAKTATAAVAAAESSANALSVAAAMGQATTNLTSVASATEEMSANTTDVAASMEQASANLSSVASATEEMSATIGEIAANSERARSISQQAGEQAASVSALMQQLGDAAQEIGQVTETITDISSQTNLLALNATIEAARAGAAGKGFAVVANEIKELAKQTAAATEDIKTKIGGVQASAGNAISDIEKITAVVAEVGHIVASIATAIEEQAAVTRDVAGNIAQASFGVQEANERVNQTATVTRDVADNIAQASAGVREANERVNQTAAGAKSMAQDIAGVDTAAAEIRAGGEQVQASAAELSQLAEQLKSLVGQFRV